MTIAEIAYKAGFNNPKNFTKYFKEEFKVLPSQLWRVKKVVHGTVFPFYWFKGPKKVRESIKNA